MARKSASRKYQLTINNPIDKGYTHDKIKAVFDDFKGLVYYCMCDEIGEQGTYHTHIFFICRNAVMFDTVKSRFYGAHIEKVLGSNEENYNYIRKIGEKYQDKVETNLSDTFEEYGTLPPDRASNSSIDEEIYQLVKEGKSNFEILEIFPKAYTRIDKINKTREIINSQIFEEKLRFVQVSYIWGKAGCGKTSYVMNKYGLKNVYRVTNYKNPFDGYKGQKVIVFEEFRSSIDIKDMLSYLDIYPLDLPCRYQDKIAQYDTVYIITNIPLEKQYIETQKFENETWQAFRRRIDEVIEMKKEVCKYDDIIEI